MKKIKSENQILIMLAFISLSIGLWENFRQLWLQDNGYSAINISKITSIGTFISVLGILFVSKKISLQKLKGFISFTIVVKFINLVNLYYLNNSINTIFINICIAIDIVTSYLITTSIYPLITVFVKNNTIYSKRKLTEYIFKDVGILVGGFLIGRTVAGIVVDYNVCLYISIIFLVVAMFVMFNIRFSKNIDLTLTQNESIIKYVFSNKLLRNYTLYTFIGCIAYTTALGLKMLVLTNYFEFTESIATNYLVVVGLVADLIGVLALKYLTPKNDYITISIKFGIRFIWYVIAFLSDSIYISILAITWSLLISTAYENVCDGYYINAVNNEYQLSFTNFRYIVKYIAEAVGMYLCGLMYEKGLRYMFGLSALFLAIQLFMAYRLIYLRTNSNEKSYFRKIKKYNLKKEKMV